MPPLGGPPCLTELGRTIDELSHGFAEDRGRLPDFVTAGRLPASGGDRWLQPQQAVQLGVDVKPLTLRRILSQKLTGATPLGPVDAAGPKALDSHTVLVPMTSPYGSFLDQLAYWYYLYIVPAGFNPAQPNGTGPFVYQSFTPGQRYGDGGDGHRAPAAGQGGWAGSPWPSRGRGAGPPARRPGRSRARRCPAPPSG
jgi:hypothetical protein